MGVFNREKQAERGCYPERELGPKKEACDQMVAKTEKAQIGCEKYGRLRRIKKKEIG